MKKILLTTVALLGVSVLPLSAQTQTRPPQPTPEVGGAAGALSGGNVGNAPTSITAEERAMFQQRMRGLNAPSARFEGNVVVGAELPGTVRYYDFENEPRFTNYRYTRLNDRYVLVNRQNRVLAVFD